MLITNSMTIIQYMVSAGSALAKELSATEGGNSFFADPAKVSMLKKGLKKVGIIDSVGYLLKILISYLVVMVSNISVMFIAISRIVELSVRAMFAPVGVADLFGDGNHAAGIRYLKKIFALALQFALAVIITDAFLDAITGSGKFGSTWLTCLGLTVTKIGLLFKSMSIANDVAGV